jgi:hypothetical protein
LRNRKRFTPATATSQATSPAIVPAIVPASASPAPATNNTATIAIPAECTQEKKEQLKQLLAQSKGNTRIHIKITVQDQQRTIETDYRVAWNPEFVEKIVGIIGADATIQTTDLQ